MKNLLRRFVLELHISIVGVRNVKSLTNLYRGCSAEDILEKIYFGAKDKQTIVELGLGNAYTTSVALLACRDGVGHLWTIDWCKDSDSNMNVVPGRCKRAIKRIKKLGLENYWTFCKEDFFEFPRKWSFDRKIDFLLVDEDGLFDMEKLLEKYDPLISSNGVIYVHNVGIREKTRKEVISFCTKNLYSYRFENTKYGLAIMRRKLDRSKESMSID
jgi:predicted O-methyltransferase YrrM